MIDLEDLPRMESLSPVKDVEDGFSMNAMQMTNLPMTSLTDMGDKNCPTVMESLDYLSIGMKTNLNFDNVGNSNSNNAQNNNNNNMILGGGLRYISQVSNQMSELSFQCYRYVCY